MTMCHVLPASTAALMLAALGLSPAFAVPISYHSDRLHLNAALSLDVRDVFQTAPEVNVDGNVGQPSGWTPPSDMNRESFDNFGVAINDIASVRIDPALFCIAGASDDVRMGGVMPWTRSADQANLNFVVQEATLSARPTNVHFSGSARVSEADVWSLQLVGAGLVGLRLRRYVGRRAREIHA